MSNFSFLVKRAYHTSNINMIFTTSCDEVFWRMINLQVSYNVLISSLNIKIFDIVYLCSISLIFKSADFILSDFFWSDNEKAYAVTGGNEFIFLKHVVIGHIGTFYLRNFIIIIIIYYHYYYYFSKTILKNSSLHHACEKLNPELTKNLLIYQTWMCYLWKQNLKQITVHHFFC